MLDKEEWAEEGCGGKERKQLEEELLGRGGERGLEEAQGVFLLV